MSEDIGINHLGLFKGQGNLKSFESWIPIIDKMKGKFLWVKLLRGNEIFENELKWVCLDLGYCSQNRRLGYRFHFLQINGDGKFVFVETICSGGKNRTKHGKRILINHIFLPIHLKSWVLNFRAHKSQSLITFLLCHSMNKNVTNIGFNSIQTSKRILDCLTENWTRIYHSQWKSLEFLSMAWRYVWIWVERDMPVTFGHIELHQELGRFGTLKMLAGGLEDAERALSLCSNPGNGLQWPWQPCLLFHKINRCSNQQSQRPDCNLDSISSDAIFE